LKEVLFVRNKQKVKNVKEKIVKTAVSEIVSAVSAVYLAE